MNTERIKQNLKSGLTVSLISIPLSVSLAVSSGATPLTGIITAIWAGLVAAIFGGSNFNIVGPTGALSGVIATYVIVNGLASLPMVAIVAGAFILLAYALKLERYLVLIPSSVVHGFTLGVAFIIGLGQLNFALGLKGLPAHETFFANLIESSEHLGSSSFIAFGVFAVFFAGLMLFKRFTPKLPGAIILAPLGIALGYLGGKGILPIALQTLGDKFGDISFQFFLMPKLSFSVQLVSSAAVIALIAILETMLSAKIADKMTHTKHNGRKEMLGLGLANVVSGLFGGMPATAALARTSLNVKTGATHKTSGIINSISVALISLFFLGYFKYIPLAVIASILVFVAVNMVEKAHYAKLWRYERSGFLVAMIVAAATIVIDPIVGILVGVSISLLIFVDNISRGHFELKANSISGGIIDYVSGVKLKTVSENAEVLLYSFQGKLCYVNARSHTDRFEANLKNFRSIVLRLREVYFIDADGIEALDEIIETIEARGQRVVLTGIGPNILPLVEKLSVGYRRLKERGLVFDKAGQALDFLGVQLKK